MQAFEVLGDPVRRRVLELIADGEVTSGGVCAVIRAEFGISQPAVSQHLRVLRDSGFATVRAAGTRRLYAVNPEPLREVAEWLDPFRRFWAPHLDALATELARGRRERRLQDSAGRRVRRPATARAHRRGELSMIEVIEQINAVRRRVGRRTLEAGEAHSVIISQVYAAPIDDVWDACTNPIRIPRWFLPVTGDLKPGGHYQLEGNAGGTIERCDPPREFTATWEFGGQTSWIEVRLTGERGRDAARTRAHRRPRHAVGRIRPGRGGRGLGPGPDRAGDPPGVGAVRRPPGRRGLGGVRPGPGVHHR